MTSETWRAHECREHVYEFLILNSQFLIQFRARRLHGVVHGVELLTDPRDLLAQTVRLAGPAGAFERSAHRGEPLRTDEFTVLAEQGAACANAAASACFAARWSVSISRGASMKEVIDQARRRSGSPRTLVRHI